MNDFDFDCAQKKRIARGAFNRKGTTNRKGCRLPHENLTKKELEKLNGEIKSTKLGDPMSWEAFKELPKDIQEEYIKGLARWAASKNNTGSNDGNNDPVKNIISRATDQVRELLNYHPELRGKDLPYEVFQMSVKPGYTLLKAYDEYVSKIAPEPETTAKPTPETTPIATKEPEPEVKPFRAHDYRAATQVTMCEEALRDAGLERDELTEDVPEIIYPLTGMNLELKGTPIDILATLRMSFPALLDKDKTYRFTIKADTFVIGPPVKAL